MKMILQRRQKRTVREVEGKSGRIPEKAGKGGLQSMDTVHRKKEDSFSPTTGKREERLGTCISFQYMTDPSIRIVLISLDSGSL